ncbi:MAG: hypothetical protein A3D94_08920 [Alphaproteobacteria bacterium RIFCSPHIGHO2_12_FULL_66_14]|nr:MAG: hypothetical protein A3D94_08920 [Alphaproteobacteria bacterium RIFCSPHIGHO2_12_FULL_66_14]
MRGILIPGLPDAEPAAEPWPVDDHTIRLDEMFARQLDTEFAGHVRGLLHDPEIGIAAQRGDAALEAIAGAMPALGELKERTLAQAIGPRQHSILEPLIETRLDWAAGTLGQLAQRATVDVDDASVAERIAGLNQDAATSWQDPAYLQKLGRTAVEELRYQGERRGWDPAETDTRVRAGLSDLYAGAIESAIHQGDLDGAGGLYDHAREVIAPERQAAIDRRFVRAREVSLYRDVDLDMARIPLDPAGPPGADVFESRAADLTPEDASDEVRAGVAQVAAFAQRRAERQWQKQQAEAGVAALDWFTTNPGRSFLTIPPDIRDWLAPDQWLGLETLFIEGRLRTDGDLFERLDRLLVYEPGRFATLDLDRHRLSLDDEDHARFIGAQKAIVGGKLDSGHVRYDRLRRGIDRTLEGLGIDTGGAAAVKVRADARDRLDGFETIEGRAPNGRDIDNIVDDEVARRGRGVAPVVEPVPGSPEHALAYRQLDLAGVLDRPLVADSPRLKELIRNGAYSKLHEHYHEYELPPVVLCTLGQEGCAVERAYEALLVHAAPGGPRRTSPITDGERSPVGFGGIPGGHIRTYVEEGTHSIINVTEPDHDLHDGLVQRRVVVEGDKVVLRTFGIGNNSSWFHARGNEEVAGMAFSESTDRVRAVVNPEAEKRSREGWRTLAPNPIMGPSGLNP